MNTFFCYFQTLFNQCNYEVISLYLNTQIKTSWKHLPGGSTANKLSDYYYHHCCQNCPFGHLKPQRAGKLQGSLRVYTNYCQKSLNRCFIFSTNIFLKPESIPRTAVMTTQLPPLTHPSSQLLEILGRWRRRVVVILVLD